MIQGLIMVTVQDRTQELPEDLSVLTGGVSRSSLWRDVKPRGDFIRRLPHAHGTPWRSPAERVTRALQRQRARLKKAAV